MVEPRWEVKIGSRVMATDGEYGYLQQLFVDPHQERIVALIVRPHRLIPASTVVVPEGLIADASDDRMRLAISRKQVEALPVFSPETGLTMDGQKYMADDEMFISRGHGKVEVRHVSNSGDPGRIEYQQSKLKREHLGLRVRASQQVFCRDGYAGRVYMILSDDKGRITGFVLQTGYLQFIGRKLIVPEVWVQAVDKENIHLSVDKSELESLPEYAQDETLAVAVDDVLCSDEVLRNTDYEEIGVSIKDGIVKLQGHVISLMNKSRIENAARSVAGVLDVENDLIVDQDLAIEVAQALGKDERTRYERFSVGAQHGVITLNGQVSNEEVRDAAEAVAAGIPQVRGVANFLQAPNLVINPAEQKVIQPPIGHEVVAADRKVGLVERVVINPRNRRVTAFVAHGYFPDPRIIDDPRLSGEDLQQDRRVVIPIAPVRYASDTSVQLNESSVQAAQHRDFDPAGYFSPPANWQPPYPYRWEEVLFERES